MRTGRADCEAVVLLKSFEGVPYRSVYTQPHSTKLTVLRQKPFFFTISFLLFAPFFFYLISFTLLFFFFIYLSFLFSSFYLSLSNSLTLPFSLSPIPTPFFFTNYYTQLFFTPSIFIQSLTPS